MKRIFLVKPVLTLAQVTDQPARIRTPIASVFAKKTRIFSQAVEFTVDTSEDISIIRVLGSLIRAFVQPRRKSEVRQASPLNSCHS
jgi:hypothetical protein